MQVILSQDVENLGSIGEMVNVKGGYARNFLIPRAFAVTATRSNMKEIEHHKVVLAKKKERLLNDFHSVAKKLEALTITLEKQVGQDDKIFGSVTTSEIEEALSKLNLSVSRKIIKIEEPIKTIGDFTASVQLHSEVTAKLKLKIKPIATSTEEEA